MVHFVRGVVWVRGRLGSVVFVRVLFTFVVCLFTFQKCGAYQNSRTPPPPPSERPADQSDIEKPIKAVVEAPVNISLSISRSICRMASGQWLQSTVSHWPVTSDQSTTERLGYRVVFFKPAFGLL
jgi:hypothetical protein